MPDMPRKARIPALNKKLIWSRWSVKPWRPVRHRSHQHPYGFYCPIKRLF